ncbi:MAG: hypothetical protein KC643_32250 [Nitrospira sp.]|nr:hypothetical protein [Nitrospira sp.]
MSGDYDGRPVLPPGEAYRSEVGPFRCLAVQSLPGTGSLWHVVAITKVVCLFRGSAVKQGGVACLNGVSFNKDRIYVRTSTCHTLPGGVYVTDFRSVRQAYRVLPSTQFFYLNPNTLLNQDWLLGANVLEIRGTTRMIAIHDDRALLPVRLLVTGGYIRDVRRRIGLPVRRSRKPNPARSMVKSI